MLDLRKIDVHNIVLMSKNIGSSLNMKLMFFDDPFVIFYSLFQHMIVGSQMSVNNAYRTAIQRKSYANSTFVSLKRFCDIAKFVIMTNFNCYPNATQSRTCVFRFHFTNM